MESREQQLKKIKNKELSNYPHHKKDHLIVYFDNNKINIIFLLDV